MAKTLCTLLLLLFALAPGRLSAKELTSVTSFFNAETAGQIEMLLDERSLASGPSTAVTRLLSHALLFKLYQQRAFQPIWFDGWQVRQAAFALLAHLREGGSQGLCGNDYLLAELEGLFNIYHDFNARSLPLAAENRAMLDLYLSQSFLTFATYMVEGQVDPDLIHVDWRARRRKADLIKLLEYAISRDRLTQVLEDLYPPHREYHQLVTILDEYQKISARGGWPVIPGGPVMRSGYRDSRVPLIKDLLTLTGDFTETIEDSDLYAGAVVDAVKAFQVRHGLADDGVVGVKTRQAFNVPVEERIRQIELNLERWRWMPKHFGDRHLRVNVADFSLEVIEDGEAVLRMPVIVGTQYRKTPVFSARMTYLEFAPYWTVPPTIFREDKLPLIKRNPDYLRQHHFKIISRSQTDVFIDPGAIDWQKVRAATFPGLLRMEPGPWNPLGRVKFMFPNRYNVYLHDTNEKYLFDNQIRSFSSGCIRVAKPRELANYLLDGILEPQQIDALLAGSEPQRVSIPPMPVHIQYWTAWVDQEGRVQFRPDVYFRDLDLEVALNEPAYRVIDHLPLSRGDDAADEDISTESRSAIKKGS
ncbi:MAG: L,D-transpeptidase family protein [Desulfuromonadales bacterium]